MFEEYIDNGEHYLRAENSAWKVKVILSVGSIMLELIDRRTGLNLLRSPQTLEALKKQPEVYGFPVLIPPNNIVKGHFSWRGRDYYLPRNSRFGNHIHGVVLNRQWKLRKYREENDSVCFETTYTYDGENEMFEGFSHPFRADLRYTLLPDRVLQRLAITNLGAETMPLGTGLHSTFAFPLGNRTAEAYRKSSILATVGDFHWKYDAETRFAATGEKEPWLPEEDFRQGVIVNRRAVHRECPMEEAVVNGKPFYGVILDSPLSGLRIIYEWDRKFSQGAFWNFDGQGDFFSAEPMSWMGDAPNIPLPEAETGLCPLHPGESWIAENTISISRY